MAYSVPNHAKARVPPTQNAGLSASAAPRALDHQTGGFEGHFSQLRALRMSGVTRTAEDASSRDKRAPNTPWIVEKGDLIENTTSPVRSRESMGSVGDGRAQKGGSSAVLSNSSAIKAARTASLASSKMLDHTPLSSLPSSGSLMRHLFELRRRQQEQRCKLDASIQSASPTLAYGGVLQPLPSAAATAPSISVAANATAAPRPAIQRSGAVGGGTFSTSTPLSATLGTLSSSKFSSDASSISSSLSIEAMSRRPLLNLPIDRVPFDLNTNSPGENIPCGDAPQVSAKRKEICSDENSPRNLCQEKQKNNSTISSSPYNPDLYRSPPKKEKTHKQRENLGVAGTIAPVNSAVNINGSFSNNFTGINESLLAHDDRPITFSNKSFEDLILEKIKAGVNQSSPTDTPAPKKTFLRKGTGTARFEQASDFFVIKEKDAPSPPQENSHEQDGKMQPKVKFPYLKKGIGTQRFKSKSIKFKKLTTRLPAKATRVKLGFEDKLTLEEPFCDNFSTPIRANSLHAKTNVMSTKSNWGGGQFSPISQYPRREREELAAFERLEEMADNTSLSSHASTVNSLLQKGLDTSTSTPTDSPCPARNRVSGDLIPHKSRQWSNPLPSVGHQATLAVCQSQPAAFVNRHFLDSLAHQVAGIPLNELVPKPNSRTTSLEEKRARTVQFCERGAQILEYCISECDTASEAPTASDASEYLNMSDLEALNQLSREGKLLGSCVSAQFVADSKHSDFVSTAETPILATVCDNDSVETVMGTYDRSIQPTSTLQRGEFGRREVSAEDHKRHADQDQQGGIGKQAPRHTVLRFSPPRMPSNAASHPIWEAFGSKPQLRSRKSEKGAVGARQQPPRKVGKTCGAGQEQRVTTEHALEFASDQSKQGELEAHKVLLVSKVHELEREITTFQTENAQLSKLKETLQREKEQLGKERKMFEIAVKEDRSRMEEYFEREKSKLFMEKCSMESSKHTLEQKNNTLEIINLKEEILLLKRELDRKDSMHNFTQNKLKERIKELDYQKKDLEKKTEKVINLEKENMSLKHQIDRLKLANKLKPTRSTQSIPNNHQQSNKLLLNKSVRFANSNQLYNNQILDIKSTNRKSSFLANNFGGSLPDIATESSNTPVPGNGSPYDAYLSRTPFAASTSLASADNHKQDCNTVTSASNNSSLNCSESVLADGSRLTTFANGNKKQVYPSGRVVLEYCNGDWEETLPGGATVYYYSETGTRQTTHHDSGLEEVEFSDGVTEKRLPDGSVDVSFPDGSRTLRRSDGSEEVRLTDGTLVVVAVGGAEKVLHLPNGQREVHGRGFKRREYPDGTVKVLYDDGSTKTTYPGGRVRVKDKDGNLLSDSKHGLDLTPSFGHQC